MKYRMQKKFYRKQDCGEQIYADEFRKMQLKMLDVFAQYCDAHGLRYYLSGGTLLGAIRHKGFIPWDDDIDVNMPRPDLEKLMEITGGELEGYTLGGGDPDNCMPGCEWIRLCDENVIIENYYGGASDTPFYIPLFLDIFPIEGFPEDMKIARRFSRRLKLIRSLLGVSMHKNIMAKNRKRYLMHVLMYIPAHLMGSRRLHNRFLKIATRYDFDRCEYVGVTTTVQYLPRERVLKKDYVPQIKVPFEGKEYNAPANYDVYLLQLYGDYMKLPPKEKQKSDHKFFMYMRKRTCEDQKG